MKSRFLTLLHATVLTIIITSNWSCQQEYSFHRDFNNLNERIWIDKEFWTIPLEDWRVDTGRIECVGDRVNMRVNVLTQMLTGEGDLRISAKIGLIDKKDKEGSAGFRIGLQDGTDDDIRSLCYFGKGIDVGIHTTGYFFIDRQKTDLPEAFDYNAFTIKVIAQPSNGGFTMTGSVTDDHGNNAEISTPDIKDIKGLVSMVNSFGLDPGHPDGSTFWFDDLKIGGSMVSTHEENCFGPILWSMYTLSRGTMKMTAQMPPLGMNDEKNVQLQIKAGNMWENIGQAGIEKDARIAVFKVENWDDTADHDYRLLYKEILKNGKTIDHYYEGTIRREPVDKPLVMGGMTCQYHYGFPYRPLAENLARKNPDILYFSGDQIYEGNGGYGIIRFPAEQAILNYLGKWYMFGWAFGDLMRNRPAICTHDDHEVFQGNVWGEGGKKLTMEEWNQGMDCLGGFVEPPEMVNVVVHTNSSHLPDPFDPEPMEQGIDVFYTDLLYGRVSFAIVEDRVFKSGPDRVSFWEGRKDHVTFKLEDPSVLERPDLKLLGDRQIKFLESWVRDWEGADMKVLLSQTLFTNSATHHGPKMFLYGDMDSGGWPKMARDRALNLIRKSFAFHICGDQHLPSLIQYGIDNFRDAGWAFCTPAITVGYQRRFHPDRMGWPVVNRPDHGFPNTGYYTDAFGNFNYVYAVGNPEDETSDPNRYEQAQKAASGFGLIKFDTENRKITVEAYRFLADLSNPSPENQFPGWPLTVDQMSNYGREPAGYLPTVKVTGTEDPVIEITNMKSGELEYAIRINGTEFTPMVFGDEEYMVKVGIPESNKWEVFEGLKSTLIDKKENIEIKFD